MNDLIFIAHIAVKSSAAVLLATLGEIAAERSGVLNLGVEGMMLLGALAGFAAGQATGNPWIGVAAGAGAGGLAALLHGFFSITVRSNQVLSGLALTILGTGLANFLGRPLIGARGVRIAALPIPGLADVPAVGRIFFQQNLLIYFGYLIVPLAAWVLFRTRTGLLVRAVGEDAAAADAAGTPVALVRYACVALGGLLAGLGGAYLSLAYTPGWKESMTAGQGWIAIAMVIFATWNPVRAWAGALLFGFLTALQFHFQLSGSEWIPGWLLRALPYLLTIAVLVFVNKFESARYRMGAPADLGIPFSREG